MSKNKMKVTPCTLRREKVRTKQIRVYLAKTSRTQKEKNQSFNDIDCSIHDKEGYYYGYKFDLLIGYSAYKR